MAPPIDRAHTTSATRIMLPVNAAFSLVLGFAWMTQPPARYSPALHYLEQQWSVPGAGAVLLVAALAIALAMKTGLRAVGAITLGGAALGYLGLAAVFMAASIDAGGSFTAGMWPIYVALAHTASIVSLARDESGDL